MRPCILIPAYQCESLVGEVVRAARLVLPDVLVVDDGSSDATGRAAEDAGALVVRHDVNLGKGAALKTGFARADALGHDVALTLDGDGQHDPDDLPALLSVPDRRALVLGVRDLAGAGAPRPNRMSNAISNFFLSRFVGQPLADTQCGMRRYPLPETLALGLRGTGYEIEAEVLLRAKWAGLPIVSVPIRVRYPPTRLTHFRIGRDVPRIIVRVVATSFERGARARARAAGRATLGS